MSIRVDPEALHRALDQLTELESPLAVRVAIDADILALTIHSVDEGWWSTLGLTGRGMRPRARRTVAVTVGLLVFRELVEASRLATSRRASTVVTIRDARDLTISRWRLRPTTGLAAIELPPNLEQWECIHRGVTIPAVTTRDGTSDLAVPGGVVTARSALLERMTRRDIRRADVFESEGEVFLLGAAPGSQDEPGVVLTGPARIVYDAPPDA